ncbi:Alpha-2-Macroglobulin-Like Protein 1 [Manis pentadactyla]|nr:Alpha-2-Macroglobulin-Like Protein 1 [Manis pentadactyla]
MEDFSISAPVLLQRLISWLACQLNVSAGFDSKGQSIRPLRILAQMSRDALSICGYESDWELEQVLWVCSSWREELRVEYVVLPVCPQAMPCTALQLAR